MARLALGQILLNSLLGELLVHPHNVRAKLARELVIVVCMMMMMMGIHTSPNFGLPDESSHRDAVPITLGPNELT